MSDKPLTLGMVGKNVAALHQALSERGFSILEAEAQKQFFGPATRMAVGEFQKANGINPSCEVCMATAAKLETTQLATNAANYSQPSVKDLVSQIHASTNNDRSQVKTVASQVSAANSYYRPPVRSLTPQVVTGQQPRQPNANGKMPTHLSVFASAKNTGHPIARMPFYAEVGVVSVLPPPKCNLQEALKMGIKEFITSTSSTTVSSKSAIRELFDKLVEPFCDALYRLLDPEIVDRWVKDQVNAAGVIARMLQTASELAAARSLDWKNPQMLGQILEEGILAYAKENNLPLAANDAQDSRIVWAHPLGVLATDHVGYLSFDLTRLPPDVANAVALALEARRHDPSAPTETSIWLYPMAREEGRIDALAQVRFAHDAIVVKLELDVPQLSPLMRNMGLLAMQNPGLTDWRLSPASFATNPDALLGEDGCENLFPANVALQEYFFYQVIGLTNPEVQPPELPADVKARVRVGFVNEYRLAWYPLGHSLGQIQYSLPLAPGESVNLAIIDWTRRDVGQRTEDTKEAEQLVHNQRRDRTIAETVNAAIQEHQSGSSFMGGLAGAVGASIPIKAVNISVGATHSLGGAMSESSGSRDIAASTVQKLSDNITQSSAAMRELQSTVVVQTTQHEKEAIETRTVVNYNHSHALTILYYEVLRHFRVVTEFVRRRPVVLVKIDTDWMILPGKPASVGQEVIYWSQYYQLQQTIRENRATLEAALLDKRHAEGFNALERLTHRKAVASRQVTPTATPDPGEKQFIFFTFEMKTGGNFCDKPEHHVEIRATFNGSRSVKLQNQTGGTPEALNPHGSFHQGHVVNTFVGTVPPTEAPLKWREINSVLIGVHLFDVDDVSFEHIKISARDTAGGDTILVDMDYSAGHLIIGPYSADIPLTTYIAPAPPHSAARSAEEIEDEIKVDELIDHLTYHKAHYTRALYLNQNPADRASQLDEIALGNNATILEKIENRPLEIVGDFVAYPCSDGKWADSIEKFMITLPPPEPSLDERLVTLPTRGVFAEAKLGHCNASEEVDPTRFWKWEEHPIPHSAPEIAAIEAGKHVVKDPNLQSTPFPQPLVNIVNPPNAPDPTGLANALNVLGTPNIFRDMSGREEVADLLKKLSDNSISIAGAANKAREIQSKHGQNLDKQQKDYDLGLARTNADIEKAKLDFQKEQANKVTPEQAHEAMKVAENQANKGNITPAEKTDFTKGVLANTKGATPPKPKTKKKIFIFKARDYQGMDIVNFPIRVQVFDHKNTSNKAEYLKAGPAVIDITQFVHKTSEKVFDETFQRAGRADIEFKEADPSIDVQIDVEPQQFNFNSFIYKIPEIRLTTPVIDLKDTQSIVQVTVTQDSQEIAVEEETAEKAADKMADKLGGELGIDKVVAAKIVAERAKETTTEKSGKKVFKYSLTAPKLDKFLLSVK
jgi:hypothetical protein